MTFMVLFTLFKIQMYLNVKTSLDFDWQFSCHREAKNVNRNQTMVENDQALLYI